MLVPLALGITMMQSPLGPLTADSKLDDRCAQAAKSAVEKFKDKGAKDELIGIAYVELDRKSGVHRVGHFRGKEGFYPASVIKLFYLAYAHRLLEDKKLEMSPELKRALDDMIKESTNDATAYVMDATTGTTGGPELPEAEMQAWSEKRNAVNRWLAGLGYEGVNANQKTWNEGPYGRERMFYGPTWTNRNKLTALATARMMAEIALERMVTPERSRQMLELLAREIPADSDKADAQSKEFTGKALPKGTKLWSKAGWTSTARLDVAYVKLPNGKEAVLAVSTHNLANLEDLIPFVAEQLLEIKR